MTVDHETRTKILLALGALVLGNFFATLVDVLVKLLAKDVGLYQYLLLRQLSMALLLLPWWLRLPKAARAPGNWKVHGVRALLTNIGAPSAVIALLYLPLATANVIFYAAPLITILLATSLGKESFKRHRIVVTLLGFIGVALALRPVQFGFASLLALVTAFAVAGYNLSVKWLPEQSHPLSAVFWSNLLTLPVIALVALYQWQPMSWQLGLLALGTCVCLAVYQICSVFAFRLADAGAITVAEYSGLIFAAILGWLIFAEAVDAWTLSGMSLILLPILWQSQFEGRKSTQAAGGSHPLP